jgi:hypothetical protein
VTLDTSFRTSKVLVSNIGLGLGPQQPGGLGIDKVAIKFPLDQHTDLALIETFSGRGRSVDGLGYALHVKATYPTGNRAAMLRLEFNPSRLLDPDGSQLASADYTRQCAESVLEDVATLGLFPGVPMALMRMSRLDIARDFGVEDPQPWIDLASRRRVKWCRSQPVFYAPDGGVTGVSANMTGTTFSLYDKGRVHAPAASVSHSNLRFEVQLKNATALKTRGLVLLSDLNTARVETVVERAWKRTLWGSAALPQRPADIVQQTSHSPMFQAAMLGLYEAKRLGINLGIPQTHAVSEALRKCRLLTHRYTVRRPVTDWHLDWSLGSASKSTHLSNNNN